MTASCRYKIVPLRLLVSCLLLACSAADTGAAGRYSRVQWGGWLDQDRDCRDTRTEILIRDSLVEVIFTGPDKCRVTTGLWLCPYTGRILTRAADIDIDHVIPLAYAHRHGGDGWTRQQKKHFANDPDNLIAVEDTVNRSKGSRGIDRWLPPRQSYRDQYLEKWNRLLLKYGLKPAYPRTDNAVPCTAALDR
jgi:hypothetical protein